MTGAEGSGLAVGFCEDDPGIARVLGESLRLAVIVAGVVVLSIRQRAARTPVAEEEQDPEEIIL